MAKRTRDIHVRIETAIWPTQLKAIAWMRRYHRIHRWFNETFPDVSIEMNYDSVIAGTTNMYLSVRL